MINRDKIKPGMKVWAIGSNYACYELEVVNVIGGEVKAGHGYFDFDEVYPTEQAALQAVIAKANEYISFNIRVNKFQDIKKQAEQRLGALNGK